MTARVVKPAGDDIIYPDCDGKRVAENTLQFQWITTLQGNLDIMYRHDPMVVVAGDLLWYPVHGKPEIRMAPDVMVAFGLPKGRRGSYKQWCEGNLAPQVAFEILYPEISPAEIDEKFGFYEYHGIQEYYTYDPERVLLMGFMCRSGTLERIEPMNDWVSPRLGIRFDLSGPELVIWRADGERFLTFVEAADEYEQTLEFTKQAKQRIKQAEQKIKLAKHRIKLAKQKTKQAIEKTRRFLEQAEQDRRLRKEAQSQAKRLADRLRDLGIDPES